MWDFRGKTMKMELVMRRTTFGKNLLLNTHEENSQIAQQVAVLISNIAAWITQNSGMHL